MTSRSTTEDPASPGRPAWRIRLSDGVNHEAVLREIADETGWSARYAFLILISAAISLLGLLMPSVAVLIGAMLLSPLMMPIIGLGFGIATFDFREIRRAATALLSGSAMAVALSVVLVLVSPVQTVTSEIAGRTQPTLFDLLVALLSAIAGGYALIRGRGGTVVGVAIAIALMPPLVVVGFGIATWNWTIFSGSLLLFVTNAITIALTAALVARCFGFGSHLSPRHTGWQVILFVAAIGILSVPLGAALRKIAFQAVAQRQVREALRTDFPEGARISQLDLDPNVQPLRIRGVMLVPALTPNADMVLGTDLQRRLGQAVDVHVDQVRISAEAAEAAEIAQASDSPQNSSAEQQRMLTNVGLVTGTTPAGISVDEDAHAVRVAAAPLPGLELAGYRILETRAATAAPGWQIALVPPASVAPPQIAIEDGVIDDAGLALAAWGSSRLQRSLIVSGGTPRQRDAITTAIRQRGGIASAGSAGGALRLNWSSSNSEFGSVARPAQAQPNRR